MTGILAVFNNVETQHETEFNEWYNQQHVLERVAVPGFLNGRRYRSTSGRHRYFAWYATQTPQVLQSPAYLERLEDPTRWTGHVMPHFTDMVRSVCERVAMAGEGVGASAGTLELSRPTDVGEQQRFVESAFAAALAWPGVVAVEYWAADYELSKTDTTESRMRAGEDAVIDAMLVVHAMDTDALTPALASVHELLAGEFTMTPGSTATWQLLFSVDHVHSAQGAG